MKNNVGHYLPIMSQTCKNYEDEWWKIDLSLNINTNTKQTTWRA
jgi:hypothetical protein